MKSIQCQKRLAMSLMLLCGMALMAMAEQRNYVVSGVVKDRQTMRVLSQVNVSILESNISTVTNDDGYFLLKSSSRPDRILVSLIGYKSRYVSIDEEHPTDMTILMSANNIMLNEIFVLPDNPYDILSQALHRVNDNYGRQQRLMQTFYRETAQKHSRYIYVAEAVGEMLKTGYNHGIQRDWVSIVKGRSLVSPRPSDTLGVKIQGGPVLALRLDVVKNQDIIFNAEELQHYKFSMLDPEKIDDRLQNVIGMEPGMLAEHALFYGKFYVDNEDFKRDLDSNFIHNNGYGVTVDHKVKLHLNKRDDAIYNKLLQSKTIATPDNFTPEEQESRIYQNYKFFCECVKRLFLYIPR